MTNKHGGDLFAVASQLDCDWRELLDFSASINPCGPSPDVKPAIQNALDRIVHYPEREPTRLREVLANAWMIKADQIIVGNGATELLFFLARVLGSDRVHLHVPVFSEFHRAFPNARMFDGDDCDTWPTAGLTVLTRPENPTGQLQPHADVLNWLQNTQHPVLVDESFIEFTGTQSLATLTETRRNLFVLRSLTKFYAIPGLRVGVVVASRDDIKHLQIRREPWQVNTLAAEAAIAAVLDQDHGRRSLEFVASEREWLALQVAAIDGLHPQPSVANYLYVRVNGSAADLCARLLEKRILIRNCTHWPGLNEEAVRIAVRPRDENQQLLQALREIL